MAPQIPDINDIRGHVQTIFGKINVIMTLNGGGSLWR